MAHESLRAKMRTALDAPKQAITIAVVSLFVGLLALFMAIAGKRA